MEASSDILKNPGKRLMKIDQLEAYLGVSKYTIYRLRDKGEIPFISIGRCLRFDQDKIDQWLSKKNMKIIPEI